MIPVLLRFPDWLPVFGGQAVTSFGAFLLLALVAGGWVLGRGLGRAGLRDAPTWDLVVVAAVAGLLGAKLYYLILHFDTFATRPAAALFARGGFVWYGGLLGGALAVFWRARRLGLPLPALADAAAPALALGYAVGRIGCFLVGDDYGLPTASWLGVAFPQGSPPTTSLNLAAYFGLDLPIEAVPRLVRVHPTQLYEAGLSLLVLAALWRAERAGRFPGRRLALYLLLAGAARFAVEFVRAKDDRLAMGLTVAQLLSVGLAVAAGAALLRPSPRAA